MTIYNTGNPIGSTDTLDRADNSQNLDLLVNGPAVAYDDRLGVSRKSWAGFEADFSAFLLASGYEFIGDYDSDGPLLIERPNQVFTKDGEYWRSGPALTLPYTTVNNWATDEPNFVTVGDAVLRQALAGPNGTDLVYRGADSLTDILTGLETEDASLADQILDLSGEVERFKNLTFADAMINRVNKNLTSSLLGVSPINILGDSISHGAFGLNLFTNGWVNLFKRMANAEFGISATGGLGDDSSYGFVPWVNIGAGPQLSTDIHAVNAGFVGWSVLTNAAVPFSLSGTWARSTGSGSVIDISVPTFMTTMRLFYVRQPGGGTFDIVRVSTALAETVIASVDTNGALDYFKFVDVPITDNGRGTFRYRVKSTSAGQIDMEAGASYLANIERSVVNNFSTSGRRLAETDEAVIREAIRGAQFFVCALSHNDAADAESTPAYFTDYQQRINWIIQYANSFGTKVVFADFCWTFPENNAAREELRRAASECSGILVDFPSHFKLDGSAPSSAYLVTTLGLFDDAAHPNVRGHQVVAEIMAKACGLSVSSKRQALEYYDWWLPLNIDAGANVQNSSTSSRLVSAVRRTGGSLQVRLFLRTVAADNPFPVGVRNIQTAWPVKYDLAGSVLQESYTGMQYHTGTGALLSQVNVSTVGVVRLNQIAAAQGVDVTGNATVSAR